VYINGPTAGNTRDSGKITKWKDTEFSHGLMGEDMKENTLMIRKKERESFSGKFILFMILQA